MQTARTFRKLRPVVGVVLVCTGIHRPDSHAAAIGREVAVARHLEAGEEFAVPLEELLEHGRSLFTANFTTQEGAGRPLSKGTGASLSDPGTPLLFPRAFNRVSAPDANSCAGCHNAPFGIAGGSGDIVANVFVLGQRFDFATFDRADDTPTRGSVDESGRPVTLQTIGNSRATLGMFGSGFIEMLARQMTADLQATRDALAPGDATELTAKGVSFGTLARRADGTWDSSGVAGMPATSLASSGSNPPGLVVRPFHQAGRVVSLREFSNNAFLHHHGMETTERVGEDLDPDGDGFVNELTRADITAVSAFQAAMAVPGRVIPDDPEVEEAVLLGEATFLQIGCADCHIPSLPLESPGAVFTEPNPYNPPTNLQTGDAPTFSVDLTSHALPPPRLSADGEGVVYVPAFTDLKLHDITTGPDDPNREPLDMQQPGGSEGFFAGNGKLLTRKLWDVGNKPNHYHHGQYTTLRASVEAHAGEALESRQAYGALEAHKQDCVIEFLKTLQVLPPGTTHLVVNEHGEAKLWPPNRLISIARSGDDKVSLKWQGGTGLGTSPRIYQLQRCNDLGGAVWEDVTTPTTETSFVGQPTARLEFYRVVLLPQ